MFKRWKWYVYISECKDNSYYTGITWKICSRMEQHESGFGSRYTKKHGFKKLLYYEEYDNLEESRQRESQIKGWSREKKERLIKGEWEKR